MSQLDDELAQAVAVSETEPGPKTTASPAEPRSNRSVGLLVTLLVIVGGILALVFSARGREIYSHQVDTLLADSSSWVGRNLTVQGVLVHGSLIKRESPCEYRFKMKPKAAETGAKDGPPPADQVLAVRYAQCTVPDTFREVEGVDVEVTAQGRLAPGATHLEASKIIAKCPSKYEMQKTAKESGARPEHSGMPTDMFESPSNDGTHAP